MIVYPNAKINLGLNITEKRPDGFHDIESCFAPIELCDILEVVESDSDLSFSSTGIFIPGNPDENLCLKAWKLIKEDYDIPPVNIHLHKITPIGAGLGGGSSDSAFTLKALNDLFRLSISTEELEKYAAKIGSDCAFFIKNGTALAQRRGEILSELSINLADYTIVLINPGIHVGTADAYSGITPKKPALSIPTILKNNISTWQNILINDFEESIFKNYPVIAQIKEQLIEFGADYAAMTGSGSSVFGIFKNYLPIEIDTVFKEFFTWKGKIL